MSHFDDVKNFNRKFGLLHHEDDEPVHLTKRKLRERFECMYEELNEFQVAIDTQDLEQQADALIDLVYFAVGTAVMLNLPWQELWDDVHRANMAKVRGVTKRGHKVDMIKPPGWTGPRTGDILRSHGYVHEDWIDVETKIVDEGYCYDDQ